MEIIYKNLKTYIKDRNQISQIIVTDCYFGICEIKDHPLYEEDVFDKSIEHLFLYI